MDWYYAEGKERRGPVDESTMTALISSGKINAETLVWNQTMSEWQHAAGTALFVGTLPPVTAAAGTAVCIVTGKTFPTGQMLQTEHGWVSAGARDLYYQALRERAPLPFAGGATNAFADRKYVVVPATNAQLPRRCVKTNRPVADDEIKQKTLIWCSPWVYVSLLLNILILIVLYYVFRKKVVVAIPISAEGRRQVRKVRAIAWALFLAGVGLIIAAIANTNLILLLVPALILMLAAAIVGSQKGALLRVAKLTDGKAWLAGAGPEYLASLPQYVG